VETLDSLGAPLRRSAGARRFHADIVGGHPFGGMSATLSVLMDLPMPRTIRREFTFRKFTERVPKDSETLMSQEPTTLCDHSAQTFKFATTVLDREHHSELIHFSHKPRLPRQSSRPGLRGTRRSWDPKTFVLPPGPARPRPTRV
jgi:hypothetical protein